jgi:hypothetical protein
MGGANNGWRINGRFVSLRLFQESKSGATIERTQIACLFMVIITHLVIASNIFAIILGSTKGLLSFGRSALAPFLDF